MSNTAGLNIGLILTILQRLAFSKHIRAKIIWARTIDDKTYSVTKNKYCTPFVISLSCRVQCRPTLAYYKTHIGLLRVVSTACTAAAQHQTYHILILTCIIVFTYCCANASFKSQPGAGSSVGSPWTGLAIDNKGTFRIYIHLWLS